MDETKIAPEEKQRQSSLKGMLFKPLKRSTLLYFLITVIVFLYIGAQFVSLLKYIEPAATIAPTIIAPLPAPTPSTLVLMPEFIKKTFSADEKFFADFPYPKEIVANTKGDLLAMQCIDYYCGDNNGSATCSYSPPIDRSKDPKNYEHVSYEIKQPSVLALAKQLLQDYRLVIDPQLQQRRLEAILIHNPGGSSEAKRITNSLRINSCQTQTGKTLVTYGPTDGGDLIRMAVMNEAGAFEYSTTLADGLFVASCSVLQVTNTGIAYVECGGGDGPSGGAQLYKVDLNKKAVQKILDCNINRLKSDKAVCS